MSEANVFSYAEFTTRNIGFVTPEEQGLLRAASILVVGVGGMGGAAQALARTGVGRLAIADIDIFEVSNFNRQVFADLDLGGAARSRRLRSACAAFIRPRAGGLGSEWPRHLDDLLRRYLWSSTAGRYRRRHRPYRRAHIRRNGHRRLRIAAAIGLRRPARGFATRGAAGVPVRRPLPASPTKRRRPRASRESSMSSCTELDPVHRHEVAADLVVEKRKRRSHRW
jgi:hypothetical protein